MVATADRFGVVARADNFVCGLRTSLQLTARYPGGDGEQRRGEADRARRRGLGSRDGGGHGSGRGLLVCVTLFNR